jgi:four helix bundle protein
MNNHRDLKVWQFAVQNSKEIYKSLKKFPLDEKFGLIDQIKRAAISISTNIAEGCGRESAKEFLHFLTIAYDSSTEIDSLIFTSFELEFIEKENYEKIIQKNQEIQKMINSLKVSIKKRNNL